MHSSKHFLIGLLSIVFACGTVGIVAPLASEAKLKKKPAFSQVPLVKKIFKKTVCGFRHPQDRFVTSKDGTEVCDRTTGDIWEQNPDSNNRGILSQPEAIEFCATLDKGHGKVYELPSIQQLVSVLDYTEYSPALTPGVFTNVGQAFFWSATTFVEPMSNGPKAWKMFPYFGSNVAPDDKTKMTFVWCLRRDKNAHFE